jgi:hypothetical protein
MNRVAAIVTMLVARLRGRPHATDEFRDFLSDAYDWATSRQDALKRVYEIGSYGRFDWFQEKGLIIFSNDGVPRVAADIQFVGSTSKLTKTWLWAWANTSFLAPLTRAAEHVRHVGEGRMYERLTRAKWHADDTDGWEMTAIQAKLVGAEGMYRTPTRTGATFMTLANVRWASPDEWYERVEPSV